MPSASALGGLSTALSVPMTPKQTPTQPDQPDHSKQPGPPDHAKAWGWRAKQALAAETAQAQAQIEPTPDAGADEPASQVPETTTSSSEGLSGVDMETLVLSGAGEAPVPSVSGAMSEYEKVQALFS